MNNNTKYVILGIAGLIIGLLVAPLLFGSCGYRGNMMNGGFRAGNQMMGNIDRHFIEQMIPHHEGAIAMAKIALDRSKRPEIISLARGIIEAQERENTDMKKWYKEWFGTDPILTNQYMMGGHTMMNSVSGDIEILKTTKNFDQEFLKQMIPHHEMAIMMARMLQGSTNRAEMKTLADQIITSQAREIDMMRSWLSSWAK